MFDLPAPLLSSASGSRRPHPVTRAMVDVRTHALAVKAGRVPPYVAQADYEQAKRELTGETDPDRQLAVLDSLAAPEETEATAQPAASAVAGFAPAELFFPR